MANILILLIGGNPLPNYVVADYLLMDNRNDKEKLPVPDIILFVHTEDTEIFVNKIQSKLKHKFPNRQINLRSCNLGKSPRKPDIIKKELVGKLNEIKGENNKFSSFHLNYTGGTKTMAVHSYIIGLCYKKFTDNMILSDLDPVEYKLIVTEPKLDSKGFPENNPKSFPENVDLAYKVKLSIEDILELHDIKVDKSGYSCSHHSIDEIKEFMNAITTGIKTQGELQKKFPKYNYGKTGDCLEDFILITLNELQKKNKIKKINEIKRSVKTEYNDRPSEIDLVIMKGYQMYLISCTLETELKEVKIKAFEALYRAEQLGGEHANVIVVSMLNKGQIEKLSNDLAEFSTKRKCHLIGLEDIKNSINKDYTESPLAERLRKIIEYGG